MTDAITLEAENRALKLALQCAETMAEMSAEIADKNRSAAERRIEQMTSALQECEVYFEERADAEYHPNSPAPVGNAAMRLLAEVREALGKREA